MELINRIIHALTELHPTHPMFVHFPIALTGAAFLFILLAYWKKNAILEQAAFANIVLASLGTIAAGITGYLDNQKNYLGDAPMPAQRLFWPYFYSSSQRGSVLSVTGTRIYFRRAILSYIRRPMVSALLLHLCLHF